MRTRINGVDLFFDVEGAALVPAGARLQRRPTLVLLHGGPGMDHAYWKPAFSELADVAQVVYLDQRGCGRSDRGPREAWTLAQWGDDVRAFCDALGIERPVVCGSSFGGEVAMAYATANPQHPSKLILLSCAATLNVDHIARAFERLGGAEARGIAMAFWTKTTPENAEAYMRVCTPLYFRTPQDPDRDARSILNPDLAMHYLRAGGDAQSCDFLPLLHRIQCPTLLVGGEDDPVTTIEDMAEIAARIDPALVRFERIPKCGHGPFFDAPARTIELIREFLKA